MKRRTRSKTAIIIEEDLTFEPYVRPAQKQRKALIRLQNSYSLGVNCAAARLFGPPATIRLWCDPVKKIFELRPASPDEEGALSVPQRHKPRSGLASGFSLNVPHYLKRWQLQDLAGRHFVVELVDGKLRADLNKPVPVDELLRSGSQT